MIRLNSIDDLTTLITILENDSIKFKVFHNIKKVKAKIVAEPNPPKDHVSVRIMVASQIGIFTFYDHQKISENIDLLYYENYVSELNSIPTENIRVQNNNFALEHIILNK